MLFRLSILLILLLTLVGCAAHKELNSPCTYQSRTGCGPEINLYQKVDKVPS